MRTTISARMRVLLLLVAVSLVVVGVVWADTGNIDTTNKWAWGTNVGWINFRPDHGGATVYSDHLEGYVWAENIGWIRLGSYDGGGPHTYANDAANTYGVNNDGLGNLSGYAWSTNAGRINFDPTHSQVTINTATGEFDGYAWGENIGWIHFKNDSPAYNVVTTYYPTDVELVSFTVAEQGGAVLLAWETAIELDNLGFSVCRSERVDSERLQLNADLIPSQNPGSPVGAIYEFLDEAVAPGVNYYYWLEDVDVYGAATHHGPVSATVAPCGRYRVYLPLVAK